MADSPRRLKQLTAEQKARLEQIADNAPAKAAPPAGSATGAQGSPDTEHLSQSDASSDTDAERRPPPVAGVNAEAGHTLSPGTILGNYVIIRKLGEGGMGTVYLAEHSRMQRFVALKVLSSRVIQRPDAIRRFRREVQVVSKLSHENIVTAHDADEINGLHILVMEYVEGTTLSSLVRNDGPLPLRKAVDCIVQTARGLQYAHAKGIVHRDIKPGNLMISGMGVVKILDLGLARFDETIVDSPEVTDITDTGSLMGTIDYLAPEQARDSSKADQRSDIYSLGCTLFHLLTGKPVFAGRTLMERLMAHSERAPPSLRDERNDVSMELDAVFRTMVAKEPADRYPSMAAVLHSLSQCEIERQMSSGVHGIVAPKTDGYRIAGQPELSEPSVIEPVRLPGPQPAAAPRAMAAGAPGPAPSQSAPKVRQPAKAGAGRRPGSAKSASPSPQSDPPVASGARRLSAIVGGLVVLLVVAVAVGWWNLRSPDDVSNSSSAKATVEAPPQKSGPARMSGIVSAEKVRQIQDEWAAELGIAREQKNSVGMTLLVIPPGEFRQGTSTAEIEKLVRSATNATWKARYQSEGPQHAVNFDVPFLCSAREVTQSQYTRVMGTNPAHFASPREGDAKSDSALDRPVEQVSWLDAVSFCNQLSKQENLRPCYAIRGAIAVPVEGDGYRLPTEAEWEYVCRAGSEGEFSPANPVAFSEIAWHLANSDGSTQPVGTRKPNAFGLHDVHGNVLEWCNDWYDPAAYRNSATGSANASVGIGSERVIRGGCWNDEPIDCRCASRSMFTPDFRSNSIGFRVVKPVRLRR